MSKKKEIGAKCVHQIYCCQCASQTDCVYYEDDTNEYYEDDDFGEDDEEERNA